MVPAPTPAGAKTSATKGRLEIPKRPVRKCRITAATSAVATVPRKRKSKSGYGPRRERASTRSRCGAQAGSSAELDGATARESLDRNTWTPIGAH